MRFKGYGPEDDMWLPSSSFNRSIHFETTSKYGRKRRHTLEPDENVDQPLCAKRKMDSAPSDIQGQRRNEEQGSVKKSRKSSSLKKCKKDPPAKKWKAKTRNNKGKAFRSSLRVSHQASKSDSDDNERSEDKTKTRAAIGDIKQKSDQMPKKGSKSETPTPASDVINLDDISEEEITTDMGVLADVVRQNDNFKYPRRILSETIFPDVDSTLVNYSITSVPSNLTDPITATKIPPHSVLEKITKEFSTSQNRNVTLIANFPLYGDFNKEGIRILKRFHLLKRLRAEVAFEKKWIKKAFQSSCFEKEVTQALLDRWNLEVTYLASYDNYKISSQELSFLCGERYLSDEVQLQLQLQLQLY